MATPEYRKQLTAAMMDLGVTNPQVLALHPGHSIRFRVPLSVTDIVFVRAMRTDEGIEWFVE